MALGHAQVIVAIRQSESEDGVTVETVGTGPDSTPGSDGHSDRRSAFNGTGIDSVEFLVSLNPGEPPSPLSRAASGGEASTLMLATKTTPSTADQVPMLVFDEIDAGMGGWAGSVLGQKLWGLSKKHQVQCVTHLPQMASYADHHTKVAKLASDGRPVTSVEDLDGDARVGELSQMLGSERVNPFQRLGDAATGQELEGEPVGLPDLGNSPVVPGDKTVFTLDVKFLAETQVRLDHPVPGSQGVLPLGQRSSEAPTCPSALPGHPSQLSTPVQALMEVSPYSISNPEGLGPGRSLRELPER